MSKPTCLWPEELNFKVKRTFLTVAHIYLCQWDNHMKPAFPGFTHCAVVACDSEWVSVAFLSTSVNYNPSGVLTLLFDCYMAAAMWSCCHLSACSVYTIQPCTRYSVSSCKATGKGCMDLLHAIAVTWGWNRYGTGEENSGTLSTELSLLPIFTLKCPAGLIEFTK